MIEIKRLTQCTLEEAVQAWNAGFEGYFFDATTNEENFLKRMAAEDLSPGLSVVAFDGEKPIGIILNGIRSINGEKIGWNGGTGVAKEYRGSGVGRKLMEATLEIYEGEGVNVATLEAISENKGAISLYEKLGFLMVDELEYLELKGSVTGASFQLTEGFQLKQAVPKQIGSLPFYKGSNPWQTLWQSAKEGEAIILWNSQEEALGYAYYRRSYNDEGNHIATVLYQCEASNEAENPEMIIKALLHHVFDFKADIRRVVINLPMKESSKTGFVLKEWGFKETVKQVYMKKQM